MEYNLLMTGDGLAIIASALLQEKRGAIRQQQNTPQTTKAETHKSNELN